MSHFALPTPLAQNDASQTDGQQGRCNARQPHSKIPVPWVRTKQGTAILQQVEFDKLPGYKQPSACSHTGQVHTQSTCMSKQIADVKPSAQGRKGAAPAVEDTVNDA